MLGLLLPQVGKLLLGAYVERTKAKTNQEKLDANERIEVLQGAQKLALAQVGNPLSATALGRWLIVVPWGIHWALVFLVSIINPNLGTAYVILEVPKHINDMALILVPAIVIADAGALTAKRFIR